MRNGYLVFEKYYSWGSPYKYAVVHFVTKSVTSALIGIALDKGYLQSLDQKLIEFFQEYVTVEMDQRYGIFGTVSRPAAQLPPR